MLMQLHVRSVVAETALSAWATSTMWLSSYCGHCHHGCDCETGVVVADGKVGLTFVMRYEDFVVSVGCAVDVADETSDASGVVAAADVDAAVTFDVARAEGKSEYCCYYCCVVDRVNVVVVQTLLLKVSLRR